MAATNKRCFEKKCVCASCKQLCSRCNIGDETCEKGVAYCSCKKFKPYEKFKKETAELIRILDISEDMYNQTIG